MADLQAVVGQIAADEQPRDVTIYQRNGLPYLAADGTPATISVLGSESAKYKQLRADVYRDLANAVSADDAAATRIAIAAAAVVAWHGWESDGKPLPCSVTNVRGLLVLEHILIQVENGVSRRADFFGGASAA